ncbi:hypothetical protein N9Y53_01145 [Candidatus Pelagibacter bacterium]|jgi:hypothetical protein|nr:hypothetical protein [Candidatus Pelagibacter bacterium]
MRKIIILILILFPNKSFADQGLEISCLNLKSALFGRKYKPLNFKLEATAFHYFDDQKGQFQIIKSSELDTGEDYFTARFKDYELGFQIILFEGEEKPRIVMSKYDYHNDKFLEHYACTAVYAFIN